MRSRLARAAWRLAGTLLLFVLAFPPLYAALERDTRPVLAPPVVAAGDSFTVYVADWDYHTSIIVPQAGPWRLGPPGAEDAPWLEYAWGDRRFYRDGDHRPHAVFATLVLPTESVVYLEGRAGPPARGARAVYARRVDARTLGALVAELERSVRRDARGARLAPSPPVRGFGGRFLLAHGAYLWASDCNRWTVDRLHAVGLAKGGAGVVFSGQVAGRLAGFARR